MLCIRNKYECCLKYSPLNKIGQRLSWTVIQNTEESAVPYSVNPTMVGHSDERLNKGVRGGLFSFYSTQFLPEIYFV